MRIILGIPGIMVGVAGSCACAARAIRNEPGVHDFSLRAAGGDCSRISQTRIFAQGCGWRFYEVAITRARVYPGFISTRFISNSKSLYNPCKTNEILGIIEIYLCFPRVLRTVCGYC